MFVFLKQLVTDEAVRWLLFVTQSQQILLSLFFLSGLSGVRCLYCKTDLSGSGKVQDHICSQHVSQSGGGLSCPLCSLICSSQQELQEHLLSCHMEAQEEQGSSRKDQASTSYTVTPASTQDYCTAQEVSQPNNKLHVCFHLKTHQI